jgi:hypothetical protein
MTNTIPSLPESFPILERVPVWKIVDRDLTLHDEGGEGVLEWYDLDDRSTADADALRVGGRVVRDLVKPETFVVTYRHGMRPVQSWGFTEFADALAWVRSELTEEFTRRVPQSDTSLALWTVGGISWEISS